MTSNSKRDEISTVRHVQSCGFCGNIVESTSARVTVNLISADGGTLIFSAHIACASNALFPDTRRGFESMVGGSQKQ
jgi:hypothetical protein